MTTTYTHIPATDLVCGHRVLVSKSECFAVVGVYNKYNWKGAITHRVVLFSKYGEVIEKRYRVGQWVWVEKQ